MANHRATRETTRYEVYEKRALYQDYRELPLLDRTHLKQRAVASANAWGGLVLKLRLQGNVVLDYQVVHMHKARVPTAEEIITLRQLYKKLYGNVKQRPKTKFRRVF